MARSQHSGLHVQGQQESFSLQSANMESYITLQKQRSYGGRSLSQIQHTLRGQGIHLGVTFWELPWGVSVTVCPPASKDSHPSICKYIHSIPRALKNHPITSLFFPGSSDSKESACNAGDWDSIPALGISPGEGNSYPLQYSCLENSMDWWAIVHWLTKGRT